MQFSMGQQQQDYYYTKTTTTHHKGTVNVEQLPGLRRKARKYHNDTVAYIYREGRLSLNSRERAEGKSSNSNSNSNGSSPDHHSCLGQNSLEEKGNECILNTDD